MNFRIRARTSRGFTVLELMITVAVLAILLAVAVPNFRTTIQNNRLTSSANSLTTAFQLARSEALKRKQKVEVCAGDDESCDGTDWTKGWVVITDNDGDDVLRVWQALEGDLEIDSDGVMKVSYLASGQIDGSDEIKFTLSAPDCAGDSAREISVSRTGRVSVKRVECTSP